MFSIVDTVVSLRKKLNTNERERLDVASKTNEQVYQTAIFKIKHRTLVSVKLIFQRDKYFCCIKRGFLQVNRLDGEVAKLRSQLEKGEAVRQNLEFELTKARRDISHEKRSVCERDALISEVNDTMKRKPCCFFSSQNIT